MERKKLIQHIVFSASVSFFTIILVGILFLAWVRYNPETMTRLFGGIVVNNNDREDQSEAFFYPAESVVIDAVKKANPAVVAITVSKYVPVYERYFESIPSPFGRFFDYGVFRLRQDGFEKQEVGGGSGFLISEDGYIVTNRHVVDDTTAEYAVFMNDGNMFDAEVVYRDDELDLAVIKIEGDDFPYLPFGNSDNLEVGQSVIAIGNALAEFRNTVSLGIVSGLARSIVASGTRGETEALSELIQTDAAVNPGNSGGPLLNLSGEVVGVNVAVASGAENIGFALSANSVREIVESVTD